MQTRARSRRVRLALDGLRPGEREIRGAPAHYLARVHRLQVGELFSAFDPVARLESDAEVLAVDRDAVRCRLAEPRAATALGLARVTLIQCAGKGDKVDQVVRSATALGVSELVVATSAHGVVRFEGTAAARSERWRAIALDAARQSGRGDLPRLEGPLPLAAALAAFAARDALKLCLEPGAPLKFADALASRGERELALLVGPEGGFADEELELAASSGFVPVRLGALVLRTELAAVAALGAVVAAD